MKRLADLTDDYERVARAERAKDFVGLGLALVAASRSDDTFEDAYARLRPGASSAFYKAGALGVGDMPADVRLAQGAFLEGVRQRSVLGRIGARQVPPNTPISTVTTPTTGAFGHGPVSEPVFSAPAMQLTPVPVSAITAVTVEAARSPNATVAALVARDLENAVVVAQDAALLDGAAAVAGVRPASILFGIAAMGTAPATDVDVAALVLALRGGQPEAPYFVASLAGALALATARDTNGNVLFPNAAGGTLLGLPLVVSAGAAGKLVAVDGATVFFADGRVDLDEASHATLQMSATPSGTPGDLVSLWQTDTAALRARAFVDWKLAAADGATWLDLGI